MAGASVLYAGWVEADRFFNARTILLNQIQKDHGIRLKIENPVVVSKGVLRVDKSEVSLGVHGSGVLEKIVLENHNLLIASAQLQVFEDNPTQWVYGLCGDGSNVQITIEQLTVKTAIGKTYSLGKFIISSTPDQGLKGVCDSFTVSQYNDQKYLAEGDLASLLPAFENRLLSSFVKFTVGKNSREVNGIGAVNGEINSLDSLLFQIHRPLAINFTWRGKSARGFAQIDGLDVEILLAPEQVSLKFFGKGKGFDWQGQINDQEESYQIVGDGEITIQEILKAGSFSEKYKLPESWSQKIKGVCELKRDRKNGRLEFTIPSISKREILEEVLP